jgi:hypothetical protein
MKDMIQTSVNDALVKRKEERKNSRSKKEKEGSQSDGGSKDSRLLYYKERVDEFEEKFKQQTKEK